LIGRNADRYYLPEVIRAIQKGEGADRVSVHRIKKPKPGLRTLDEEGLRNEIVSLVDLHSDDRTTPIRVDQMCQQTGKHLVEWLSSVVASELTEILTRDNPKAQVAVVFEDEVYLRADLFFFSAQWLSPLYEREVADAMRAAE
jgi:hypothetical protein